MKAPKAQEKVKVNTSGEAVAIEVGQVELMPLRGDDELLDLLESKAGYPVKVIATLYNQQTGGTIFTVIQI